MQQFRSVQLQQKIYIWNRRHLSRIMSTRWHIHAD